MSVKIRLSRIGKKHVPFYRIISVDSRKKRDGAFLEDLGTYDALNSVVIRFDEEGYQRRLSQGAIASDAVKKIYNIFKKGSPAKVKKAEKKVSKKVAKAAKEAEAAQAKEQVAGAAEPETPKETPQEAEQQEPEKETTESKE